MGVVSVSHRVSADELTAAGHGKYLTGLRILDASRNAALGDVSERAGVDWLPREHYVRVVAPVDAGERVTLLVSLEDAGSSTVRVCTRVVRNGRDAIACAFQTLACLSRAGDEIVLPTSVVEHQQQHAETSVADGAPSFAERVISGGALLASLFADLVLADTPTTPPDASDGTPRRTLSAGSSALRSSVVFRASMTLRPSVASDRRSTSSDAPRESRRSGLLGPIPEFAVPVIAERGGAAFVFPDVDAYDGQLLRELYDSLPYLSGHVDRADAVARRYLRTGLFRLVDADTLAEHDAHLRACPELTHLGAFLTGLLFAEALGERGVRPDVLVGRGVGEVSALSMAGVFDVDTALEIVAHRAIALKGVAAGATDLPPEVAQQFDRVLSRLKFKSPRLQVYSAVDGSLYAPDAVFTRLIASHLLRESDLGVSVRALQRAGCEYFVECGTGGLTRLISETITGRAAQPAPPARRKNLAAKLATAADALAGRLETTSTAEPEAGDDAATIGDRVAAAPVAITGIGCVLAGANNLEEYWRQVVAGESAIRVNEPFTTEAWEAAGFAEQHGISAGVVDRIAHDARLPFTASEFDALTRTQQMLALAMRQCMTTVRTNAADLRRVRCMLGASAEGMREHEERSLVEGLAARLAATGAPQSLRDVVQESLEDSAGPAGVDPGAESATASLGAVVERFVQTTTDLMLVDAACASSLYAIDLGMKSLRTMQSDLMIVGGIFTPGVSWQPLHSLFEGLIGSDAAPFDRRADGTVFGEGVVLLALERLSDAVGVGDRIHGVIRGVGLSCDGKKASVSEPHVAGQALALRRAYGSSGVDVRSVQLVEGHGMSNPAFDAVEVDALRLVFGGAAGTLSPRPLQSVKALVGHTVWAAGAASVVKVCRALEEHVVPPQRSSVTREPASQLEEAGFHLPVSSRAWPPNLDGEPRRAGVSAFGLGGTNAHAVVEAFAPMYHTRLAERTRPALARAPMAIVGLAAPSTSSNESLLMELRAEVRDQLDGSQFASVLGADRVLSGLPNWRNHRERTGVVVGMVGRTARAFTASERVYRDELRRVLTTGHADFGLDRGEAERIADTLYVAIGATTTGLSAHTLMGLLPNIAAARVSNLFDLQGPNAVIDAGGRSVLESLAAAERWLTCGTADVMLVTVLRADLRRRAVVDALTLCLATPDFARKRRWPMLGELTVGAQGEDTLVARPPNADAARNLAHITVESSRPLAGLDELAHALDAKARRDATLIRWKREERGVATAPRARTTTAVRREIVR